METFIHNGKRITVTAPSGGYEPGDVIVLRSGTSGRIAIVVDTIAAAATGSAEICGVHKLAATAGSGLTFSQGDILYWDATASKLTKTASGNTRAGMAAAAKTATAAVAYVLVNEAPR